MALQIRFKSYTPAILYYYSCQGRTSVVVQIANNTDTEAPFLDLHLSIANGFVSSKIYD